MHQHLTVARVAEGLGVAWHTANDAVLAEGKRVLIAHPGRSNDPGRGATGRRWSRWMGLTGFTTAATGGFPDAVAVMGPFHVVGLGGNGLDRCRRRIQRATTGRQGREDDPLHRARPTLRTGAGVLTDKRQDRLEALLAVDARVERPGTPNKPTETINDRLEHLRDSAPGSTSPTNHITRPPPETSGHRPRPHPNPEEPVWIQQKIMERASRRCRIAQRRSEPPLEAMISLYQSKDFLRYRASVPVPSSSRST